MDGAGWLEAGRAAGRLGNSSSLKYRNGATARLVHDWARPMSTGRDKRIKSRRRRRNPVARTLRDPAFRARREANRRRYSRKLKQERDDA